MPIMASALPCIVMVVAVDFNGWGSVGALVGPSLVLGAMVGCMVMVPPAGTLSAVTGDAMGSLVLLAGVVALVNPRK